MRSSEIILGTVAMLGYGMNNSLVKIPITNIGTVKTIFLRGFFNSIMLSILLLFSPRLYFSLHYVLFTFGLSIAAYIPFYLFFKAIKLGKLGLITPIANSSVIFTILLSIFFFKEKLTPIQIILIGVIIIGIVVISINIKDITSPYFLQKSSGIPFALITCILWGLTFFLYKIPSEVLGPFLTAFIIEFGIMISSGIHLKISRTPFNIPDKPILINIFLASIFGTIGTLAYFLGISVYNVSIIAAIAFANPSVSIIFGNLFYKERLDTHQYSAILMIIIGIIMIFYVGAG